MKRSSFTLYTREDTIIYEYKNFLFIMEECQQGQTLNPAHGPRQFQSDISALSAKIELPCSESVLGAAILKALNDYDSKGHPFEKFDLKARNKYIASLVGARGLPSFERDSRIVNITRALEDMSYTIWPTDNNNLNPWIAAKTGEDEIHLPATATETDIGSGVLKALSRSTYHPLRKTNTL